MLKHHRISVLWCVDNIVIEKSIINTISKLFSRYGEGEFDKNIVYTYGGKHLDKKFLYKIDMKNDYIDLMLEHGLVPILKPHFFIVVELRWGRRIYRVRLRYSEGDIHDGFINDFHSSLKSKIVKLENRLLKMRKI